jgi:hypothetical protein
VLAGSSPTQEERTSRIAILQDNSMGSKRQFVKNRYFLDLFPYLHTFLASSLHGSTYRRKSSGLSRGFNKVLWFSGQKPCRLVCSMAQ